MNEHDAAIMQLYDEQHHLYMVYVGVERGDGLASSQQVSPKAVREARAEWHAALDKLRAAGGDVATVRRLLNQRVTESEVKAR